MDNTYLAHHGILGMRWGIRRYQNKDGSLTELGKKRLAQYTNRNAISGARSRYYSNKTENVTKQPALLEELLALQNERLMIVSELPRKRRSKRFGIQLIFRL